MMTRVISPHSGLDRYLDRFAHRHRLAAGMAIAIGNHETENDEAEAEQKPRYDAGHEQADDGNCAAGGERIDDGVMARRYQQRLDRSGDRDVGRKNAWKSALLHLRDHDRADGGGIGDG